jgi:NitT/TauT family transport system substrate-binding protein
MESLIKPLLKALLFFVLLTPGTIGATEANQLTQARLMLQWLPQAQFAGYYMAQEKGYYTQHGIDLTIVSGGPDKIVSDDLDTGKIDFGMMFLATAIERHAAGLPIVNIGQIIQHSTLMLIARADSEIEKMADLDGHKVSLWANEFQIQPRMLFKHLDIEVTIIPQTNSLALFLHKAVSATSAMWYNEYHTLLSSGLRETELKPFFFRDTAFDFPEDGIYCLASTYKKNPQLARNLLQATVQGWQYAFAHEDETLDIIGKRLEAENMPVNRMHQRWMLRRMRDILAGNDDGNSGFSLQNCILSTVTFTQTVNHLIDGEVISAPIKWEQFYRGPLQ